MVTKKVLTRKGAKPTGQRRVAKKVAAAREKVSFLRRSERNPIIQPAPGNSWESKAAFNAGAFEKDGKVHLLYRAIGNDDVSVLGYARSDDGIHISERLPEPAFVHRKTTNRSEPAYKLPYTSGGGWNGGCEDPRLTCIDGKVYLLFTDFDGWGSLRIALSSIDKNDFMNKNWDWEKPVPISPPGEVHKNWVLFPEKINGKFAILHSFYPHILIDYFDSLSQLDGTKFIKSDNSRPVDKTRSWDSWFRGVGPPPIKTDAGWLILYHAMDHRQPDRYRLGALVLDLKDPTKILYRSKNPILEPEEYYENQGYKWGVVYSCGAVVIDGTLFVYYGGADKVTCVASADLNEFLKQIKSGAASPKLSRAGKK
ncbi:MAG: glycosidase [Candidatus Liptonbacteria bacterium]